MATALPEQSPPRAVRVVAWLGVGSLLPYAAIKSYWALGGTAGMPSGFDMAREFEKNGAPAMLVWMERHGIDFTAVLAALGAALLLMLIHPLSARLPPAVLLTPAWLGAVVLVPWGLLTAVVAVAGGDSDGAPRLTGWLTVAAVIAFCGIGSSLAVCARSYQVRSRRVRSRRARAQQ